MNILEDVDCSVLASAWQRVGPKSAGIAVTHDTGLASCRYKTIEYLFETYVLTCEGTDKAARTALSIETIEMISSAIRVAAFKLPQTVRSSVKIQRDPALLVWRVKPEIHSRDEEGVKESVHASENEKPMSRIYTRFLVVPPCEAKRVEEALKYGDYVTL
tara:strand:+ start:23411 stop:23890 length:480 start_codon:yes stop_codon:yes gene_type:complete